MAATKAGTLGVGLLLARRHGMRAGLFVVGAAGLVTVSFWPGLALWLVR